MNARPPIYIALIFILSSTLSAGCQVGQLQRATSAQHSPNYTHAEIIVRFRSDAFDDEGELVSESVKALNAEYKLVSMEPLSRGKTSRHIYKLEFPEDVDIIKLVQEYTNDPSVLYAEPNYTIYTTN